MSAKTIAVACAFVWGMVAGVSLAIMAAGQAQTATADGIGILHIDGVPIATFTGMEYDYTNRELYLSTHEIVLDCLTDRIFHDDFEGQP